MNKIILILLLSLSALYANIGSVMVTKGKVEVKRAGEIFLATNGMKLFQKDEIVTQARARAQVMLKDETVITIGPKSSFSFEEYSFDGTDASKLTVKAKRGFFRSVTGRIGKVAPERFKVKTASATIGIRGTDFSGNISAGIEVFKCYSGGITVAFEGGLQEIDAGMMMELSEQKVEVKKINSQKGDAPSSDVKKKRSAKQNKQGKGTQDKKIDNKVLKDSPIKIIAPDVSEEIVEEEVESEGVVVEEVLDAGEVTTEIYITEGLIDDPVVDDPVVDDPVVDDPVVDDPVVDDPVVDDPVVDDPVVDDPVVDDPIVEPFEVTPGSEDRQTLY